MSSWNIGITDVSEEVQAFKDKLASRDGHIAAQQTALMKQTAETEELRATLNDALHKLTRETTRVLELESDLKIRSEDLRNEKIASQNITHALATAQEKVKEKEFETRDLQSTLESLSHTSDGHRSHCVGLEREKIVLEARLRELQVDIQQKEHLPSMTGQRATRRRRRSSSVSESRVMALEQELSQLHALLDQKDVTLVRANEKVLQAQNESVRVGNEKLVLEKRTSRQLADLQAALEEKEDELRYLRGRQDDGSRERELLERIDEDGAKLSTLEKLLGEKQDTRVMEETLRQMEKQFNEEHRRVMESDNRLIELIREKGESLDELQSARLEIIRLKDTLREQEACIPKHNANGLNLVDVESVEPSSMPVLPEPPSETVVAHIGRLLAAIERLRGERDTLRRSVLFLETEHRFAVDALRAKLAQSSTPSGSGHEQDAAAMQSADPVLQPQLSEVYDDAKVMYMTQKQIKQLRLSTTASAIVLQYMSSRVDQFERHVLDAYAEVKEELVGSQKAFEELERKTKESEVKLEVTVLCLEATTHQRDDLMCQLDSKDSEHEKEIAHVNAAHRRTRDDLAQAEAQLAGVLKTLQDIESERNSLKLQIENVSTQLQVAQDDLINAESRNSDLQFHLPSSISSGQVVQALRDQITELEMRVLRRTEQIGLHQHDINRMETNLKLQEERLGEMAMELEMMSAQKDAMVEDCADAREARDGALARLDIVEMEMETKLEKGDQTIQVLMGVIFGTIASARDAVRKSNQAVRLMGEKLEGEHRKTPVLLAEMEALRKAEATAAGNVRQSILALALSQEALKNVSGCVRGHTQERDMIRQQLSTQQGDFDQKIVETESLRIQLETTRNEANLATTEFTNRTSSLEVQIRDLRHTISESESNHQAVVEELLRSNASLQKNLNEIRQSLAESDADNELALLRTRHTEEMGRVQERFADAQATLGKLRASHVLTIAELEESLADALGSKLEVEQQLADTSERLREGSLWKQEVERSQKDVIRLQKELDIAISHAQEAEASRCDLQASHDRILEELSGVREHGESRLACVIQESLAVKERLEGEIADLQHQLKQQCQELDDRIREVDRITGQLKKETERRIADNEVHKKDILLVNQQYQDMEADLTQVRQKIGVARVQLEESKDEIKMLQQEKLSLQEEITPLEAELQRSISLGRFLESQVKESESKISSLTGELDRIRVDLARSEQSTKAAEVNLSLQSAQHKREVADLLRQLTAFELQPSLQGVVAELEERNNEMEGLLQSKCAEIEENDDRALEMLKENKKLATKVESLSRKVLNLQTKLAAAKISVTKARESSNNIGLAPPVDPALGPVNEKSTSHIRSNTPINDSHTPLVPSRAPSTANRSPLYRAVSGPSSLPRPKTPERRITQPTPVFKARTPERLPDAPLLPDSTPSTSTMGKKRRAPDDFEACESVPPQGFTVDSLPSHDKVENTTPRVRRVLSSLQSGFTPKRRQNPRPTVATLSPKRQTVVTSPRPPLVIADVTNSPRGSSQTTRQSVKEKRSWLGKIRGQTTSRFLDPRATFESESS